jgi:hypothetical protein
MLWKDADTGIPILFAAKVEYTKLHMVPSQQGGEGPIRP